MTYTIITYGGGEIIEGIFNAIVSLIRPDEASLFQVTVRLSAMIGLTLSTLMVVFGDLSAFIKKFFAPFFLILHLLLMPTSQVLIRDPVTHMTGAVDHVPWVLAATAGTLSTMMDSVTQAVESVFALPDDLQYNKTGFLFASKMILKAKEVRIPDPTLQENLKEFVAQCVTYDVMMGIKYTLDDLIHTTDIWGLVSENASPARSFAYRTRGSPAQICTCREGAALIEQTLKPLIKGQIDQDTVLRHLPMAVGYLMDAARGARELLNQQMMMAAVKEAVAQKNLEMGNSAGAFAAQRAKMQQRNTYQTLGYLAAENLPLMKTVIEALAYGIFLFIVPFCLLPMGWRFLTQWFRIVLWVQMWAPLYAILNFIMTVTARHQSGEADGLTLANSTGLYELHQDLSVMAGYLSLMIPILAWGLLKANAQAFTALASSLGSVASGAASTAAAEQTTGSYSYGNVSQGQMQIQNTSMGQHQTSPNYQSGAFTAGDGELQVTSAASGRQFMNLANSNLRSNVNFTEGATQSLNTMSSEALSTSESQMVASQASQGDAYRSLANLGQHQASQQALGKSWATSDSASYNESATKVAQSSEEFSKSHGLSLSNSTKILASASANTPWPIFKASAGIDLSREGVTQDTYTQAQQYVQRNELQDSFATGLQHVQDNRSSYSDETSQRYAQEISGSMDMSRSLREESSANLQQSQNYQKAANWTEQNGYSLNENSNQEYVEWLADRPSHGGRGEIGQQGAKSIISNQPEVNRSYQRAFAEQKQSQVMGQALQATSGSEYAIRSSYESAKPNIQKHYDNKPIESLSAVQSTAHRRGFGEDHKASVMQNTGGVQNEVHRGQAYVDQKFESRKQTIQENTDRTERKVSRKQKWGVGRIIDYGHKFPNQNEIPWGAQKKTKVENQQISNQPKGDKK